MLHEIIVEFLGECPQGYEFVYLIFEFILFLIAFGIVFFILNSFFKIFKIRR